MFPKREPSSIFFWHLLLALVLATWVIFVNIPAGRLFLYSDFYFPMSHSPEILARYARITADWNYPEFNNPRQIMQIGYQTFVELLYSIGLSMEFIQKLMLVALLTAGGTGLIFITTRVSALGVVSLPIYLSSILIYFFNPFAISSFWQRLHLGIFVYALFPLMCLTVVEYLRFGRLISFFAFLCVFFLMTQSSNPVFLTSAYLAGIFFGWLFVPDQRADVLFRRALALSSGCVLISLYWVIPFLSSIDSQILVVFNNSSAPSVSDLRRVLAQQASALNWFALNPFWTGHNDRVVLSADWLIGVRPLSIIIFSGLIGGILVSRSALHRRFQLGLLALLLALILLMLKSEASFLIWGGLESLVVGLGYRDPFEKLGFIINFILAILAALAMLAIRRRAVSWLFCLLCVAVSWPALSGGLFGKAVTDPYQQLGAIPSFFQNPNSVKQSIGSGHRIVPMPLFESTFGVQYRLDSGYFVGATPLYWQNGVQIVSGNTTLVRGLESLLGSADSDEADIARDYHSLMRQHSITAILWSKNVVPRAAELRSFRSQQRVMQLLIDNGCVSRVVTEQEVYQLFTINSVCHISG